MGRLLEEIERRSNLMCRMMDRLGVDMAASAAVARGTILTRATRTCFFCRNSAQCRAWLDSGRRNCEYRSFCPNAERFERLPHLPEDPTETRVRH